MRQNSRAHSVDRRVDWSVAKDCLILLLRESELVWGRHLYQQGNQGTLLIWESIPSRTFRQRSAEMDFEDMRFR